MEILVIGATGRTGRHIVRMALNEGHRVTAFVRSPEKLDRPQTGVKVVQGDALDATAVHNLINNNNFDSVVIAIGADTLKCSNVRGDSTKNVITALENRNAPTRLWIVSSVGTNESMDQLGFFSKAFVKTILKGHIADHTNQENYLKESSLPYTIVRPTGLKDESSNGGYIVLEKGRLPTDRVSRQDVAHFIIKNIDNEAYLGKAVTLTSAKKD
ncbi:MULTISPECIES: NAD(P)-dependent oxidoreductase [Galbibacter]|uniref:NAD(P)H-binding protein n=1 Tax=Galbibacter pacificus TaxID=2996052 RepID=A0ABT6FMH4_9FLAO|nr:NAD(P)H-binding protein [Galbibacter pacificus]MDG3580808.1 NAD(P)H-binding protein [Galbibacter pacificus]MDG3584286.1 NAD(P)H-binding protein [Galbibacter pacificus]